MSEYSPEMKKSPASEEARPHFAGIPAHIHEEAYRLLPHATYREAFDMIVPLYRKYCETHPDQKVILMGDKHCRPFVKPPVIFQNIYIAAASPGKQCQTLSFMNAV